METTDNKGELKRVRTALTLNLIATAFTLIALIISINSNTTWRIVCSAFGFTCFLTLTIAVYTRLMKLQKSS